MWCSRKFAYTLENLSLQQNLYSKMPWGNLVQIGLLLFIPFSCGFMFEPVCDSPTHYYPDENCSLFYHCTNGYPQLEECPEGLYWNTDLNTCDYPENVPECIGGTRPPSFTTTTTEISTSHTTTTPTTTTPTTPPTTSPTTTTPTTPPTTTPTATMPTTSTPKTTTTTTQATTTTQLPRQGCGGILTATSGIISYKESENYENNERCIWTIHVPGATNINFKLEVYSPNPGGKDGVLIGGLRYQSNTDKEPLFHNDHLNSEGEECIQDNQELVVVTFYSDASSVTTGFRLRYTATIGSNSRPGTHVILSDTPFVSVSHPTSGTYSNNELSSFAYAPHFSKITGRNVCVTWDIKDLGTWDFIFVYYLSLDSDGDPAWKLLTRLEYWTGGNTRCANDAMLAVFQTDASNTFSGFSLSFGGG